MIREVVCTNCQAVLGAAHIDTQDEIASCGNCGRLMDLRQVPASPGPALAEASRKGRARASVVLPVGMSFGTLFDPANPVTPREVVIRRRWLRGKHWLMLALFAAAAAYVAYLWGTSEPSTWLVIATFFVVSFDYNLAGMFIDSTVVTADASGVKVRHGPLPSPFALNAAVNESNIEQLYSAKYGARFAVMAKLKSGTTTRLVAPLITAEQALFVEHQLERMLGLVDFAVEGELDEAGTIVQGKRPGGAASGSALVLLIPALIGGILLLFFLITGTDVSGQLKANGALGSWVFEPDDCTSGQREAFSGVVLTASGHPGRVIRVVRDPIRGSLVVVAAEGQPNRVLGADSCPRFEVNVERTNTSINEIWAVDGSLTIECGDLVGSAVFEGCH